MDTWTMGLMLFALKESMGRVDPVIKPEATVKRQPHREVGTQSSGAHAETCSLV